MNPESGGTNEAQRKTAAEIARRKVMAAYSNMKAGPVFYQSDKKPATRINVQQAASYKNMPIAAGMDFRKYHSAWQSYYQKYYNDYYSKAARQYIEKEKLREARERADFEEEEEEETKVTVRRGPKTTSSVLDAPTASPVRPAQPGIYSSAPAEPVVPEKTVSEILKEKVQKTARRSSRKSKRMRKFMPIIAGVAVVLVLLFLQYNRMIFAPLAAYVSPGNVDTSITVADSIVATGVGDETKLIIPKLNVEVPILLGVANDSDSTMEAMNYGVVHWSIPGASALPGQIGNMVITGHSAGDIYSSNPYKFIFSGLERLVADDLIYIDYLGVRYTYQVTKLETVEPTEVSKLVYDTDKPVITLITCTPLGTSRFRLLVTAEQISPVPSGESQNVSDLSGGTIEMPSDEMTGNEPTFFERIWNFLTGQ